MQSLACFAVPALIEAVCLPAEMVQCAVVPIMSKADIISVARFACQNMHGRSRRKRWAAMRELLVKLAV